MKVFGKGSRDAIAQDFRAFEFDCPCDHCSHTFIDEALPAMLQAFRNAIGTPVHITSGYRCIYHQRQLSEAGAETAVGISQHTLGRAFDCKVPGILGVHQTPGIQGIELEKIARSVGFRAVGVGAYFIHADLRNDKDRRWEYSY